MRFADIRVDLAAAGYKYGPPRYARDPAAEDKEIVEAMPCRICGGRLIYHQFHEEDARRRVHLSYAGVVECEHCGTGEEF